MGKKNGMTIDPQLLTQLAHATAKEAVGATFTLKSAAGEPLSAKATKAMVQKVLSRIKSKTKSKPADVNVFANLQSFAVSAPPAFVEQLLHQPEIDSAMANEQTEDLMIRPVESIEVPAEEVLGGSRKARGKRAARG